jgi:hypothetical protein
VLTGSLHIFVAFDWGDEILLDQAARLVPASRHELPRRRRSPSSYSPDDLFLPYWTAAVLIDTDCTETLEAIEFANLQLLEFRHLDTRLDESLAAASRTIAPLTQRALPFWRIHSRPLRALGELKVEASHFRTEFLELIVVLLSLIEIVLAFVRH